VGHYCWVCDGIRPNEAFSGKGHKQHICKKCAKKPREERERVKSLQNIHGFLIQRNISERNIAYLKKQCKFPDEEVQRYAKLVLEIARIKPHKRKRVKFLAQHRPELLARLVQHFSLPGQKDIEVISDEKILE